MKSIKNKQLDWHIDYKQAEVSGNVPLATKNFLTSAHLVLLLISIAFLATDFSSCEQMKYAINERRGPKCCILPILLDPIPMDEEPLFKCLESLPEGEKALSGLGNKQREILVQIRKAIEQKIQALRAINKIG